MKSYILKLALSAVLIVTAINLSAQMVGSGPANQPSSDATAQSIGFFIRGGIALPVSNTGVAPEITGPAPADWSGMPVSDGTIGAGPGFNIEAGIGLNLAGSANKENMFGFYYYPIVAAYWQTALNWSELGEAFEDRALYTKPFRVIDIGQRYGLGINPVENLSIGIYYRPGLIIPLDFEVVSGTDFRLAGTASSSDDSPVFMMSHAGGIAVKYLIAEFSAEMYFTRPTMDVTYINIPLVESTTLTGKIPVKLLNLSLALSF